jgi:hypothetical protein
MTTELLQLAALRLDEDLTYRELAEHIGVDHTALFRLLNTPSARPNDRTLHKIRRYLDGQKQPARRATAR